MPSSRCQQFLRIGALAGALAIATLGTPRAQTASPDQALCSSWDYRRSAEVVPACTRLLEGAQPTEAQRVELLRHRSYHLHLLHQYAQALTDRDEVVRLRPDDPSSYAQRAETLERLGELDRAVADYDRVIQLRPAAEMYRARGIVYQHLGQHWRAIEDFDRATRTTPGNGWDYVARGELRQALGEYDRALADFTAALSPNHFDQAERVALTDRCLILTLLDRADDALRDCTAAFGIMLPIQPYHVEMLNRRALAYLRLGRLDDAQRDYDAALAIRIEPGDQARSYGRDVAMARFGRAVVLARHGDTVGARTDLVAARQAHPGVDAEAARIGLRVEVLADDAGPRL